MNPCDVDGCDRARRADGMCEMHYRRYRRTGTTEGPEHPKTCSVEGCTNAHKAKGLCNRHYIADLAARHKAEGRPAPLATEVVHCGFCGQRLGTIRPGGSPWAAIDAHHCNRRTAS